MKNRVKSNVRGTGSIVAHYIFFFTIMMWFALILVSSRSSAIPVESMISVSIIMTSYLGWSVMGEMISFRILMNKIEDKIIEDNIGDPQNSETELKNKISILSRSDYQNYKTAIFRTFEEEDKKRDWDSVERMSKSITSITSKRGE